MKYSQRFLMLFLAYCAGLAVMSIGCGEVESTTASTKPDSKIMGAHETRQLQFGEVERVAARKVDQDR